MFTEPLSGKRKVNVQKRRAAIDWAYKIKELPEIDYPAATKVVFVCYNLNTHKPMSLYEAFEPAVARSILVRLEIHYTPGSILLRLNSAF